MPSEMGEICDIAIAELKERDFERYKAVQHVIFWDVTASIGMSLDEFTRHALKEADRLARIRASMRPREFK